MCCIIIMGILIGLVGPAPALAGMAFLILLVQSQTIIAGRVGALRRKMTHLTDERVKFVNEMLQAIRVIKLYAWERPMEDRVNAVRDQELSTLEGYLNTNAAMREMLFMAQPLAVLVIYAVSLYGMNRQLSVVEVFRVLSFLNTTRLPLNLLGVALKFNRDGLVSLERSQKFLILATLQGTLTREKSNNPKIDLEDARFSWQEFEETPNNSDKSMEKKFSAKENSEETTEISPFSMNLTFKTKGPNDLIAVIGTVGSGKSSLISAILGDMPCGSCRKMMVDGTISYCAQSPWIQNMSLRDNVLFGSDYADSNVSDRYEDAIEAAALLPDLKILPNGDGTESKCDFCN